MCPPPPPAPNIFDLPTQVSFMVPRPREIINMNRHKFWTCAPSPPKKRICNIASYNQTSLIRIPAIQAPPSTGQPINSPYFMLTLQKLWAIQWVWPIVAYVYLKNRRDPIPKVLPRHPDKRGLTVHIIRKSLTIINYMRTLSRVHDRLSRLAIP